MFIVAAIEGIQAAVALAVFSCCHGNGIAASSTSSICTIIVGESLSHVTDYGHKI